MNWPEQGIHKDVPFNVYRSCDIRATDTWETIKGKSVSKSLICDFIKDPAMWKNALSKETTGAMKAGSLLDCVITEPDKFKDRYVVSYYPEFRSKEAKSWKAEQEEAGLVVVKQEQFDAATAQVNAIYAKPEALRLVQESDMQVAFRYDTKYPFGSKGLIDMLPNDGKTIVDLKTCQPTALLSKRTLAKYIFDWGYHIQAGAYCDGYSIATGEERIKFKFIFVSSAAPYTVAVVELPLPAIMYGADIYRAGMAKFAECMETDTWPGIWDGEVEIDIPQYGYGEEGAQ